MLLTAANKPTDHIGTKNIHAITALNEIVKQRKTPKYSNRYSNIKFEIKTKILETII